MSGCGDPTCPCQDGDPCNYEDHTAEDGTITKAMPRPGRDCVVLVDGETIRVTNHAVDRWTLRVAPAAPNPRVHLTQTCNSVGRITPSAPAWAAWRGAGCWLMVGDDIALPVVHQNGVLLAVTVLARGDFCAEKRAERNYRRARRTAARRAKTRNHQKRGATR